MIRLAVRCRPEQAERVLAELLELVPGGVEEEQGDGWVEYAVYGPPGELPAVPEFEAAAGDGLVEISSTEIPDDWADRWRDFHEPVALAGGRIMVRPSWERWRRGDRERDLDIEIDPGQAFGTGAHHTTAMCLELLLELADEGEARGPLVDLGTGSGVLAIAAAKLGWAPVTRLRQRAGVDRGRDGRTPRSTGSRSSSSGSTCASSRCRSAPTIVANLTAPLLETVAERLSTAPRTPRLLRVCSPRRSTGSPGRWPRAGLGRRGRAPRR